MTTPAQPGLRDLSSVQLIAVSASTRDDIVRDLSADPARVHVVPEGIAPPIAPTPPATAAVAAWGIRSPYLLFVSQWRPHKRIEDLVEAFEQLAPKHPKLQLVLAGKPNPLFPAVIDRVEHSPARHRIITPGFVPDETLPALYANAELFVFPSLYEGFGFPPLEAMSLGTPVLAANATCLPEMLGDAAEFFEAGNVGELTSAIEALLANPKRRAELAKLGKVQAAQYTWEKVAKATLELYQQVLSAPTLPES